MAAAIDVLHEAIWTLLRNGIASRAIDIQAFGLDRPADHGSGRSVGS
jgi:hypothetical protein